MSKTDKPETGEMSAEEIAVRAEEDAARERENARHAVLEKAATSLASFCEKHPYIDLESFLTSVGLQLGLISRR